MAHTLHTLFSSTSVVITDFRCDGCHSPRPQQEFVFAHEVAITRRGAWVCRNSHGVHLADPTRLMLFNNGMSYDVEHPVNGGDHCTALGFTSKAVDDVATALQLHADADRSPFSVGWVYASPRIQLWAGQLHAALNLRPRDALACEELSLRILGEAMACMKVGRRADPPFRQRTTSERRHQTLARDTEIELARRFREPIRLADLARTLGCSPFHLARVFKQCTGDSIHQRLLALRLSAAFEWISTTGQEIGTVAHELGFADHAHLSAAFARRYGTSPTGLRRLLRCGR